MQRNPVPWLVERVVSTGYADLDANTVDKAKTFARDRPWATAALVGVLGLAVINTLRGK